MRSFFKDIKLHIIVSSIACIILGIVLILFPDASLLTIAYLIGATSLIVGIFNIIQYFVQDIFESYYRNDFLFGILGVVIGVLIVAKPEIFISIAPFILGLIILISGFLKLQNGVMAYRFHYQGVLSYLILSIINIALGVIIILNPFETFNILFIIIGFALVYSGISDIFSTLYLNKKLKDFIEFQRENRF